MTANYLITFTPVSTGVINKAPLTVTGAFAFNKVYDGITDAEVDFTIATLDGVIAPDVVDLDAAAYVADFDTKNVGNAKPVTVTGVVLTGAQSGNYSLTQPTGLTADITPLDITGAFTADNKAYDGTTDATVATRSLVGTVTGDVVNLDGGTATFASSGVGTGITVTLTGATLRVLTRATTVSTASTTTLPTSPPRN